MTNTEQWRDFDPDDMRTRPPDHSRVEWEYTDGKRRLGRYLAGFVPFEGELSSTSRVQRWRYLPPSDSN